MRKQENKAKDASHNLIVKELREEIGNCKDAEILFFKDRFAYSISFPDTALQADESFLSVGIEAELDVPRLKKEFPDIKFTVKYW